MIVMEGQQQLGEDAHKYYDKVVRELKADTKYVEHVQDLWGDRLTAAGAQSPDGKAYSPTKSGRKPRHDLGPGIHFLGPEYSRADTAAAWAEGLCHRPVSAIYGHAGQPATIHSEDDRGRRGDNFVVLILSTVRSSP